MGTQEQQIIKQFKEQRNVFDKGTLIERYKTAKQFTETYCTGTLYHANVEEYCCNCTVTRLRKGDDIVCY